MKKADTICIPSLAPAGISCVPQESTAPIGGSPELDPEKLIFLNASSFEMSEEFPDSVDEDAFFKEHHRLVWNRLYPVLRNVHDTNDLTQEVMMKVARYWSHVCRAESKTAYVLGIARHEYVQWLRKRRRSGDAILDSSEDRLEEVIDTKPSPDAIATQNDALTRSQIIRSILAATACVIRTRESRGITARQKCDGDCLLLVMKYNLEMSEDEMSVALGIPAGNIHGYVQKCLKMAQKIDKELPSIVA